MSPRTVRARRRRGANVVHAASGARRPLQIAVVIPLYNKAAYVERAIRSVQRQTRAVGEIVVVDDGSTDAGPQLVEALAKADDRIRLIRQSNAGASSARNRGIAEARSEWVSFLDADDAQLPWFVEEIEAVHARCSDGILLGTAFREIECDFALDTCDLPSPAGRIFVGWHFYDRWWKGNIFHTSSVCVRRSALLALGTPFPADRYGEDLDLFFRLAERGAVAWSSRVCALYAVGVPNSLMSATAELDLLGAFIRLRSRTASSGFPRQEKLGAYRTLATYWLTLARRRLRSGDAAGAWGLMTDPITLWRPTYWVRTGALLLVALASGRHRGTAAGRAGEGRAIETTCKAGRAEPT